MSPAIACCLGDHVRALSALIEDADVDLNLYSTKLFGITPAHACCVRDNPGRLGALSLLVSKGININAVDSFGLTPLDHAVRFNSTSSQVYLLLHHATSSGLSPPRELDEYINIIKRCATD